MTDANEDSEIPTESRELLEFNFGPEVAQLFSAKELVSLQVSLQRLSLVNRLRKQLLLAMYSLERVVTEIEREFTFDKECAKSHRWRCNRAFFGLRKAVDREAKEARIVDDACTEITDSARRTLNEYWGLVDDTFFELFSTIKRNETELRLVPTKEELSKLIEPRLEGVAKHCVEANGHIAELERVAEENCNNWVAGIKASRDLFDRLQT